MVRHSKYYNKGNKNVHRDDGEARYPDSDWGGSSEFGRSSEFYQARKDRPFDMDNYYSGRQFSVGGVEIDHVSDEGKDLRDNWFNQGFSGKGPKGYRRSDARIHEEVCEALYRSPFVDASDIEVSVTDGRVCLKGTVDSRNAKREAESCIENLSGIEDVQNELRLQRPMEGDPSMTRKSGDYSKGIVSGRNH